MLALPTSSVNKTLTVLRQVTNRRLLAQAQPVPHPQSSQKQSGTEQAYGKPPTLPVFNLQLQDLLNQKVLFIYLGTPDQHICREAQH